MGAKDVNDPDRPDIQEQHFAFYYNRYYKKQLNVRFFGKETVPELFEMVNDTVALENGVAVRKLREDGKDDMSFFVKLAEESRRFRQERLDAGDETVRLKFSVLAASKPQESGLTPTVRGTA